MSENKTLISSYSKAESLFSEINSLLDQVASLQKKPDELVALDNPHISDIMSERKKDLKLTLEDIELQTGISTSTLKRMFSSPDKANFSNMIKVLNELGLKTWLEK